MQATVGKMEAGIHTIRSKLENTNRRTVVRTRTTRLQIQCALGLRPNVTNTKTHGTFNETRSQIQATKREFHARLEADFHKTFIQILEKVYISCVMKRGIFLTSQLFCFAADGSIFSP
jgi:hypothetical protein